MPTFVNLLPLIAGMHLLMGLGALLRSRWSGSRLFAATMFIVAAWAAAYHLELRAADIHAKTTWIALKFACLAFLSPAWLGLVTALTGRPTWLRGRAWWAVLSVPVLTVPIALTMHWHGLFRYDLRLEEVNGVAVLTYRWGPWGLVYLAWTSLLGLLAIATVFLARRDAAPVLRRQLTLVFLAFLLPLAMDLAFVLGFPRLQGVDLAAFTILATAWVWAWALYGHGTLELVPMARSVLLDHMSSLVFVVDGVGRLADVNAPALRALGRTARQALGRRPEEVMPAEWLQARPGGPEDVRVRVGEGAQARVYEGGATPIVDTRRGEVGTLHVYHDVTERTRAREAREAAAREVQRLREERRYLAQKAALLRDLHDGLGGISANIGLLSALGEQARTPAEKDEKFRRIAQLAAEESAELRSLMNALEAQDFTWTELLAEIRRHGEALLEEHGIAWSFDVRGEPPASGPGLFAGLSLFRVVKEALTNVVRHSGARRFDMNLEFRSDRLLLRARDDGRGLAPSRRPGRGLANMRSRAADLGGTMTLEPGPGLGLSFELPLPLRLPEPGDEAAA